VVGEWEEFVRGMLFVVKGLAVVRELAVARELGRQEVPF